ncbi:tyrosine-type recombinase/integrase [Bdellovibrio sp. KM01]|uniref:tyrosine-type recombinase/integrase n=1 Tax=Bdellovibrio sp. KM01 TaxID=2748865 RepID=UPI0015E96562|nr:tyrosine-type recombinase/integrase [Bdellovibrio sp. KM01]QLY25687.1 tyrosine-type recombinase/integrase [Bdellovibrio sp. KM01]
MGIKFDEKTKAWTAFFSNRHPITKVPKTYKRVGLKSKAEAQKIERELVVKMNNYFHQKIYPLWDKLLTDYCVSIDEKNELMKSTIYNREKVLRLHTLPAWDAKRVDQITTPDIHKLLNERLGQNAEAHRKFFIKCLKGVFQYAVEEGILIRNPTPLIKFKVNDKIKAVLTEEQILTLLRRAQELDWHWYPHYAVALYTGMRNGELYALMWDKVNLEQRQILVNCSWSSKDGYKSTKSGDDRLVEIPKPLMPVLTELKLQTAGNNFVLPRLSKWDKGEQARELRFLLKSLGLPEIRFHDLRASWATLLLGKGVAPSKVMSMGGWKDMDTMMIYMRKAGIDIKDSTKVLDDLHIHKVESGKLLKLPDRS